MTVVNTDYLDKINEQLSGITDLLDKYCEEIQKGVDTLKDQSQDFLDEKMEELGDKATEKLAPVRQGIIDALKPQVETIKAKIAPIEAIMNALPPSADLGALVSIVTDIATVLIQPYQPYIDLLTILPPKVTELSNNIQAIVNYSPNITVPTGVTVPTPNISCEPITPSDIGL